MMRAITAGLAWALLPLAASAMVRPVEVAIPSGVKAWLAEDSTVPVIQSRMVFTRAGYAHEPAGKEGVSSFVCSMLFEGAGEYDGVAFYRELEKYAIEISCDVDEDNLILDLKTLRSHREQAYRLLSLMLTKPRLEETAAARVRGQLKAALKSHMEEPEYLAGKALKERLFASHPYHRVELASETVLDGLTPADAKTFIADHLARNNLIVSVAGDVRPEELSPLLESVVSGLPSETRTEALPEPSVSAGGGNIQVTQPIPHVFVGFALPGIRRQDPDYMAAFVLNHILGGGTFASRLMHEVRERSGLVYGINMYIEPMTQTGVWWGGFTAGAEGKDQAITLTREEIRKVYEKGVTAEELASAKRYLIGNFPLNLDTNAKVAGFLTSMQLFNLGIDYLEKRNGQLEAVTLQQVNAVARRLLDPAKLHVAVVSPETEKKTP